MDDSFTEKQPLLDARKRRAMRTHSRQVSEDDPHRNRYTSFTHPDTQTKPMSENVTITRHLNLSHAVGIMVGSVCGTGIFVSPTGVTRAVGSVGLTIVVWTACGLFNLLLALCYAELGTAMPVAGGDYYYINHLLGPLPAFLCLWTICILIAPCAGALMGRTIGAYFTTLFDLDCSTLTIVLISIWVTLAAAVLNSISVKWSARIVTLTSLGKLIAMGVIIVTGLVKLGQGYTDQFENIWEGSTTDPSQIVVALLPGFVTYAGWESVTALSEEMINPERDLPLAAVISMLLVIGVYILINIAYFTVLTPLEFVASDAVALSFGKEALPTVVWLIPVFVMFSSCGSIIGSFLVYPRFAFAGGRDSQLPKICSFLHIKYLTPIPAIIMITIVTIFFDAATFFDINALLNITGIIEELKIFLALIALVYLKIKRPDLKGTIRIPIVFVIMSMICLVAMVGLAVYADPLINGIGVAVFAAGVPLYYMKEWASAQPCTDSLMGSITKTSQCMLKCVPETKSK